ncbi:MAG: hypothetical protein GXP55_20880 [Deltaproteobacteria bacterium]|nr:hypothetical protein [Deltaproteobacteria bacterium]
MKKILPILAALALVFTTTSAQARRCGGVTYPAHVSVGGTQLTLNGLGIREATIFNVDVYVAALYLEAANRDGNAVSDSETKKRLVLHFVRDVDGSDIQEAWSEGFQGQGRASAFRAQIRRLNGWMSDMSEGDVMTFTYEPGTGLTVSVRGRRKGTIEGADFAHAFFRIWLGAHPPNRGLKVGLLGGHCG